jgi:uncharacterized protein (DUF433 family)
MNSVTTLPDVFSQDAEVMRGALVFRGTRIPAQTFFDHLDHGGTVDQFLEWYDGVSRDQLNAALGCSIFIPHRALRILFDQGEVAPRLITAYFLRD